MQRYIVKQAYRAYRDGQWFGPWEKDTQVELSEQDAAWVNRDSPGTLAKVAAAKPEQPQQQQRQQPPKPNRQQKPTPNRGT